MGTEETNPKLRYYRDPFLSEARKAGDPDADAIIAETLGEQSGQRLREIMRSLSENRDLHRPELPEKLQAFYRKHAILPEWADVQKMRAGAAFFAEHSQAIMSMLGTLSLPYCYAGADGAQVLFMSKRIYQDTSRRLLETGQFVLDVVDPRAFESGRGFASVLNVRLMHAAIRYHILGSGHWDPAWGHPINQEDMAGTISAFSFICIRGLRKVGYTVKYADAHAFQHLWNVVGHLMGVQPELLPDTGLEAQRLDACIRNRQFRPSEAGQTLTNALLDALKEQPLEGLPKDFITAYTRFLLGDAIADMLKVPNAGNESGTALNLLKWRNALSGLIPLENRRRLKEIHQTVQSLQADRAVRFEVPLSL